MTHQAGCGLVSPIRCRPDARTGAPPAFHTLRVRPQEAFCALGAGADSVAEAAIAALLRRSGELGVAGRAGWLVRVADGALAAAVGRLSEGRVAAALLAQTAQRGAGVRAKARPAAHRSSS